MKYFYRRPAIKFQNNFLFKKIHFRISFSKTNTHPPPGPPKRPKNHHCSQCYYYKIPAKSNHGAIWSDNLREPKNSHSSNSSFSPAVNSLQITTAEIQNPVNLGVKPHLVAQLIQSVLLKLMHFLPVNELVRRAVVRCHLYLTQLVSHTSMTTWSGSFHGVP